MSGLVLKRLHESEVKDFKKLHSLDKGLEWERWDESAEHFGYLYDNLLVGCFRAVVSQNGELPLSEFCPSVEVKRGDIQIGRLTVANEHLVRSWIVEAWKLFCDFCEQKSGTRIYIAAAKDGPFSASRYQALGFEKLSNMYFDIRYAKELTVLMRSENASEND